MSKFKDFAKQHETELKRFVRRHGRKSTSADLGVALKRELPAFATFLKDNHCGAIDGVNKVLGVLATLQTVEQLQKRVKPLAKANQKVLSDLREDFDFFHGALDSLNDAVDQFSDTVRDGNITKSDVNAFADDADAAIKAMAEWLKYIKKTGKQL